MTADAARSFLDVPEKKVSVLEKLKQTNYSMHDYETNDTTDSADSDTKIPCTGVEISKEPETAMLGSISQLELELSPDERQLVKESWSMILNDDLLTENLSHFYKKLKRNTKFGVSSSTPMNARFAKTDCDSKETKSEFKIKMDVKKDSEVERCVFCTQFYENLITFDKNIELIFPSIRHQAVSFSRLVNRAVNSIDHIHDLDEELSGIGKRHARILGISTENFKVMGSAFLYTLQERFGTMFTLELERCWATFYFYLANSLLIFGSDPVLLTKGMLKEGGAKQLSKPVPYNIRSAQCTVSNMSDTSDDDDSESIMLPVPILVTDMESTPSSIHTRDDGKTRKTKSTYSHKTDKSRSSRNTLAENSHKKAACAVEREQRHHYPLRETHSKTSDYTNDMETVNSRQRLAAKLNKKDCTIM
ncbi:uncharacterized protein KNAG_0F00800 [Huiozyma naganishii CBS 8797]|uniref:Globin domain-containing protein n=1 Tax=Huiozyma naganishii (strain ATCC MYA-139 / BCRC 22969 / CBS 8797 / KCTC 17520 / NBRC 10181 / NCYC 3082 / Yp74L-3) TaxID=1071383 RepID=J7S736_HUIN7|nr:hypothetical protein KNAG_0F00800 [Kazachstania naganishii CBS 8797]CCK70749.1 hypothetical protein KNAG_0F00800 [Kazachstania naganishii CBS 8797]